MLQTSLLLMKSLNKTETIFLICSVFFVSKGNLFDVYFTISFIVCLCMYVLVNFLFILDSLLANVFEFLFVLF